MEGRIEISWKVDDGYVNNGPHTTEVDVEDFEDLNEQEIVDLIHEIVQNDFEQSVSFEVTSSAITDAKEAIKAAREADVSSED